MLDLNIARKYGMLAFLFMVCWVSNTFGADLQLKQDDLDQGVARQHTLVIGRVSENPKKHHQDLKPMVDYVAKQMRDLGIKQTRVLFAKNNKQMIRYLRQGKIDWVTETPFSAVVFEDRGGAEILLRNWKKGVSEYYTIFFARKESGINSLQDLKGKTIAFEDPGSTSAYFLPAATLIDAGIKLVQLANPREKPSKDMLGYVFSGQEINLSTWVYRGRVDAGAVSNLDWEAGDRTIKGIRGEIKIFYQTNPVPRALELVRKDLSPEIKKRLKEILLNAHNDPEAKEALKAYKKTKKFDEIDSHVLESLNYVRKLSKIVQEELM